MNSFGQLLICIAALLSAAGGAFVLLGSHKPRFLETGKNLLHAASLASAVSLVVLVFLLLVHDYRVVYVRDYADRTMSLGYLFMAIWGGQEGSLLLWAAIQTWFTSAVAVWGTGRKGVDSLLPVALCFLAMLQVFFFDLVLFHSNPFEPLGTIAAHGIGLNPLLRNPYMAIHPPTLYVGFVGFSVPTAFAIASLVDRSPENKWLISLRPWILFAWVFLSVGNILGMIWAYEELGWGGYWAWDPVENASFMPWLTGTALVHSMMVQERRGMFHGWSLFLVSSTFALIVFGTFLTRSGVIQSVHAFAGATAGPYLLGLIVAQAALSFGLMIWRRKRTTDSPEIEQVVSKESIFLFTNIILIISALFVLLTTMSPLFAEVLMGEKVAATPELFNKGMVPLGLILFALIAICANIGWRKPSLSKIGNRILFPSLIGFVCAVVATLAGAALSGAGGLMGYAPVVSIGLLGFVTSSLARDMTRLIINSMKHDRSSKTARRRLGGQLVHLSVVLLFVGFTGSAFVEEKSLTLSLGESAQAGDYQITFLGLREDNNYERKAVMADLEIEKSDEKLGILSPAKHVYHSHPGQPTSEVVIRTEWTEDLFLVLGEVDMARNAALIKVKINPLVVWIWLGGILLVIGTIIALVPPNWLGSLFSAYVAKKRYLAKVSAIIASSVIVSVSTGFATNLALSMIAIAGMGLLGMLYFFGSALCGISRLEGGE